MDPETAQSNLSKSIQKTLAILIVSGLIIVISIVSYYKKGGINSRTLTGTQETGKAAAPLPTSKIISAPKIPTRPEKKPAPQPTAKKPAQLMQKKPVTPEIPAAKSDLTPNTTIIADFPCIFS